MPYGSPPGSVPRKCLTTLALSSPTKVKSFLNNFLVKGRVQHRKFTVPKIKFPGCFVSGWQRIPHEGAFPTAQCGIRYGRALVFVIDHQRDSRFPFLHMKLLALRDPHVFDLVGGKINRSILFPSTETSEGRPPIKVKFEIPYFTVSGIQVPFSVLCHIITYAKLAVESVCTTRPFPPSPPSPFPFHWHLPLTVLAPFRCAIWKL